jgi:hypothetical protein
LGWIATLMPEEKEAWAQGEKRGYGLLRGNRRTISGEHWNLINGEGLI